MRDDSKISNARKETRSRTDERTPLLAQRVGAEDGDEQIINSQDQNGYKSLDGAATVVGNQSDAADADDTPMPYVQILLLCYASMVEPVAYFTIFPFVNEMIEHTGNVPHSSVGFWSGAIEAFFSLVQMVLMIFYGRLSDRLGRKPVLVFSLAGISVASALFGMGQTLWQMMLLRGLAGVFAGSSVTIRTMISENCTKQTQGRAFSWFMFMRNMGILIGPLIGGGLANPATRFPQTFDTPFWHKYPYALSTWATGALTLTSVFTSAFFLKETLVRKDEDETNPEPELSTWQILTSPGVPMTLYIYAHVMLLALAYTAVSTVCMYTKVREGGFGLSDQEIAILLCIVGASQSLWLLLIFPPLQKRVGTANVLRWCVPVHWIFMALYPIGNELLRHGHERAFWVAAPIGLAIGSLVAMMFSCIQLMVNDISPSRQVLGTMNALALTVNSAIRTFAPVLGTSIFAIGIKWGFADGHLVWFVLIAGGMLLGIASFFIPKAAEGKLPSKSVEPEAESASEE